MVELQTREPAETRGRRKFRPPRRPQHPQGKETGVVRGVRVQEAKQGGFVQRQHRTPKLRAGGSRHGASRRSDAGRCGGHGLTAKWGAAER